MSTTDRFVGIACVGADIQSEGVDGVLASLERAGVTAVSVGTSVSAPAAEGEGAFAPPSDAGASVRLFDRPLWGKRALWLRGAPSYVSRREFFADSVYQPPPANDLTRDQGPIVAEFVRVAAGAGLTTSVQINAATPTGGLRDDDVPLLPDGQVPDRMVATGSLASPAIRRWNHAQVRNLLAAYPELTEIRLDFAEYACYKLDEAFQDFGPQVQRWCADRGLDVAAMKKDVGALYQHLSGRLTNADLEAIAAADHGRFALIDLLVRYPGAVEWLRCKAMLSAELVADWRDAVTAVGDAERTVSANAFAPPFSQLTGFDYGAAARVCASVVPKLYTMHWSMMVEFWARALLERNSGLDEALVVRAVTTLFDIADDDSRSRIANYGYPEPDEAHPVPDGPLRRKIDQTIQAAGGRAPVYPLVHGYGPVDDFRRRLQVVADSGADGVWVNRYGYLSDEKLDVIADVFGGTTSR